MYNYIIVPEQQYKNALELYSNGDYFEALNSFKLLGDYKDSRKYRTELKELIIEKRRLK